MYPGVSPTAAIPLASDFTQTFLRGIAVLFDAYDSVELTSVSSVFLDYGAHDQLALAETLTFTAVYQALAADRVSLQDAVLYTANLLAADGLDLTEHTSTALHKILLAADVLTGSASAEATLSVGMAIAEALVVLDAAKYVANLSTQDTVELAEQLSAALKAQFESADTVELAETLRTSLLIVARDSVELAETLTGTLSAVLNAEDSLVCIGTLPLEDGDYQAWVMNADTTGVTQYTNFPMDSLWTHTDGTPYGLTSTGVYRLEGADDDGTPINAVAATGDLDFGTSREKNVPRAYLYLTQGGDAILKTITSSRGTRHETFYELADRATDGDDDLSYRRVPLGRGVRGIWWRFEIHNIAGSTIDFDGAEVLPVVLSRRG